MFIYTNLSRSLFRSRIHHTISYQQLRNIFGVKYYEHGDPEKVLRIEKLSDPGIVNKNEVLVTMLASPINPADLNMVEGVYPIGPKDLPAIAGNEGVGIVAVKGMDVTDLDIGDWVIPFGVGLGTWRDVLIASSDNLMKVSHDLTVEQAATISVNPCSAYRMLTDFVNLSEGDTIIQNAATSNVAQAVIQIAKLKKIKTINVVRDRPNINETEEYLKSLGADHVVTESFASSQEFRSFIQQVGSPSLALNAVGGPSGTNLAKVLRKNGTMVTYGGMSKQPVSVPTSLLIFKDIQLKGFWMSRWVSEHSKKERAEMLDAITDLIKNGNFQINTRNIPLQDFSSALKATKESSNQKVLLTMNQ